MSYFRIILLVLVVSGLSSCDWLREKLKSRPSSKAGLHLFEHVESSAPEVASIGEFKIFPEEIRDSQLLAFAEEKREIEFALLYAQFVSFAQDTPKEFVVLGKNFERDFKSILNQYGIPQKDISVKFSNASNPASAVSVDGRTVTMVDANQEHYLLGSVNTKIYRRRRELIYQKVKDHFLNLEAKKHNISSEEFLNKQVFKEMPQTISEDELKAFIQKKGMDPSKREIAKAQWLSETKQKSTNYYLEKYVLPLPIRLYFPKPNYTVKSELPWTPHHRSQNQQLEVVVFSDTQSSASVSVLSQLKSILEKYPKDVDLLYRPISSETNIMQNIVIQGLLCVWLQEPQKFWTYLPEIIGDNKDQSEQILMEKAKTHLSSVDQLRRCLIDKKAEALMKYHLDYARYLGIKAGPVVYVGGEVWYGNVTGESLERLIREHLGYPDAGLW
ncbi:MAG: thioredoxin domain-containing protein [Bdellovibrionales bacterium]|nr:thioredoxin domain-containing protein [Bdellovibrionales bacterium]